MIQHVFSSLYQCARLQANVWPVHRLDRGTSGALVLALTAEACSKLAAVWSGVSTRECATGDRPLTAEVRAEYEGLLQRAPPRVNKKPSEEELVALRLHSQQLKAFLRTLTVQACVELTGRAAKSRLLEEVGDNAHDGGEGVQKQYIACVRGAVAANFSSTFPLKERGAKSERRKQARREQRGHPAKTSQPAETHFVRETEVWREDGRVLGTLVVAELRTGRTHQIRRHLAQLGTPILGDARYSKGAVLDHVREMGLMRPFLHSW